ncbi:superoxide dismutase SodA [soil metagenome]
MAQHTLPDLPYDYSALEPHIDEQTMRIHHTKHHQAYVNNLNDALQGHDELQNMDLERLLRDIENVPQDIRTKVRNNGGGHHNHTLFWQIMRPNGGGEPGGALGEEMRSAFGDFGSFRDQFANAAKGRFGSGWAWLVRGEGGRLQVIDTANQDSPLMMGYTPILGLDVWEHAYYLNYQNRRPDYIESWWNVVNWEEVTRRFQQSQR